MEKAPWWRGFWERMVKTVKVSLKKSLGRTTLNFDELNTLLIEVETVINSRPLTYVHDDQDGVSYTLSPSHLIYGRRITNTPNSEHFEIISTHQSLTRKAQHHKNLLAQFTNHWRRDYLLSLRENYSINNQNRSNVPISLGDVVILRNESTKRMFWKLAIVEELLTGSDGQVRAAVVKVANSSKRPLLLRCSVKHLIPLEVRASCVEEENEREILCEQLRVRRQAAIEGERLRRANER